jgi:8-amino-7-oxononanoate synthase
LATPFEKRLNIKLNSLRNEGLFRETPAYSNIRVNLSGNDYFQLRFNRDVQDGARLAIEKYGTGSGASPLISGFQPCHQELLDKLLKWKHKSFGMLFNTGFLANQAIMKHLPGKKDLVLADRLIHHSIAQALSQGQARFKRYNHIDLDHLEELLLKNENKYETLFMVTESVFSMDGDYPDLKRLMELKQKVPFVLILDEAHGTGVYGETGGGLAEAMDVLPEVDILVGTLGKSLASAGAYVLSESETVIQTLTNIAGEYVYSTFLTPAQVGASSTAIDIIRNGEEIRGRIKSLSKNFRRQLAEMGWASNDYDSPIVPIIVGDANETMKLRDLILDKGILVGAVRPPTVPRGTSRLRVSLHSDVTEAQLEEILDVLKQWKKR